MAMTRRHSSDIDMVVDELRRIMQKGHGKLDDAVRASPKLLSLARYKVANEKAPTLLAADIKTAIARLPAKVAHDAAILLAVNEIAPSQGDRWLRLYPKGASAPAMEWRWRSVFGRIAVELLRLQDPDDFPETDVSYRVLRLHIHEDITHPSPDTQLRIGRFMWKLEALVADMELFSFTSSAPELKFRDWSCGDPQHQPVGRVAFGDGPQGTHLYVMYLGGALPLLRPVTLAAVIEWDGAQMAEPWLSLTPQAPLQHLMLSACAPRAVAAQYTCIERVSAAARAPIVGQPQIHDRNEEDLMTYELPNPEVGHRYRLEWKRRT